jgi:hypothetical protein
MRTSLIDELVKDHRKFLDKAVKHGEYAATLLEFRQTNSEQREFLSAAADYQAKSALSHVLLAVSHARRVLAIEDQLNQYLPGGMVVVCGKWFLWEELVSGIFNSYEEARAYRERSCDEMEKAA